jgi:hypothetical protein
MPPDLGFAAGGDLRAVALAASAICGMASRLKPGIGAISSRWLWISGVA